MSKLLDLFRRPEEGEPEVPAPVEVAAKGHTRSDLAEIRASEKAFLEFMGYRRKRLETQIGRNSTRALQVLPLLLHCNQPGVPGYVDDPRCPVGIGNYQPRDTDFRVARTFFSAPLKRTGIYRPFISLIAAMGSVGTIAFARDSDLDIWVCYDGFAVDRDRIELYRTKVAAVERWLAQTTGRPASLFLMSEDSIRENRFGETDAEGCGSAMGLILKEEFYRTHIYLAGRYPFWWLADPGLSAERYARFVKFTLMEDDFHASHYVDLGPALSPKLEEYFGAAIWQIVKAWKSPLKSVLKMALLQGSVRAGATDRPLCEELKRQVLLGTKMDPYRLLFEEALAGCDSAGEIKTAQLLGTCFYLKSATKLDADTLERKTGLTENQAILRQLVDSWGWDLRAVTRLNEFARWKYEEVRSLNQSINEYLITAYAEIRSLLEDRVEELTITDRDLTVLGRKLHAVYGGAPGKVGVMPILSQGLEEEYLSLHQLPTGEDATELWGLYRGLVKHWDLKNQEANQLRADFDPLELLAWATRNGILGPRTRLIGRSPGRFLSPTYMENVARSLNRFFSDCESAEVTTEALLGDSEIHRILVMPNFGWEEEEISEIAAVYWTSWGETFYRKWVGEDCFARFVAEVFSPFLRESPYPDQIIMLMPTREVGLLRWSHWRIQFDFPNLAQFLGGRGAPEDRERRHLGQKGQAFFSLIRRGDSVEYREHTGARELLDHLAQDRGASRIETRVEARSGVLSIVKAVVENASHGAIDVFHLLRRGREWIFINDELGNQIDFTGKTTGKFIGLARLMVFLHTIFPELASQPASPLAGCVFEDVLRIHALRYDETCSALDATREYSSAVAGLKLPEPAVGIEELPADPSGNPQLLIRLGDQTFGGGNGEDPFDGLARVNKKASQLAAEKDTQVSGLVLNPAHTPPNGDGFYSAGQFLMRKRDYEERLRRSS